MKKLKRKKVWVICPNIEEYEGILEGETTKLLPNGELWVKDKKALGYNEAITDYEIGAKNAS